MPAREIEADFPKLRSTDYTITSEATTDYNCFAWAALDTADWWSPLPVAGYYWPKQVPAELALQSFVALYQHEGGFVPCVDGTLEVGFEKIALYANSAGEITHAARQKSDGAWTSKLGAMEDIAHETLEALEDDGTDPNGYGRIVQFLKRPVSSVQSTRTER